MAVVRVNVTAVPTAMDTVAAPSVNAPLVALEKSRYAAAVQRRLYRLQARWAPGLPESTTKLATVLAADSGWRTLSTTRRCAVARVPCTSRTV